MLGYGSWLTYRRAVIIEKIMDPNANHITGMNLSDGNGQDVAGIPAAPMGGSIQSAPPQQIAPIAQPSQVADGALSDEELDQLWVNKAKDIVEQTKTDPFALSKEINKIKAEYLKVRFDKDLNISDKNPQ